MRPLTYLTFDSLQEGVGASQALSYVLKIAKSRKVRVISFEKISPSLELIETLSRREIIWEPLEFGKFGSLGGVSRVFRMSREIDKKSIVHARGNLAAISALIGNPRKWIWDCRSMHSDQRLALSSNGKGNFIYCIMRVIEMLLAKFSSHIIVITNAVKPEFVSRYRISNEKMTMISTCVDVTKFEKTDLPSLKQIRVLLSGTFSPAYDLIQINKIVNEMRKRSPVHVTVAASLGATASWEDIPYDEYVSVPHDEMPNLIAKSHCGFSIWHNDLGVCLKSVASTKTAEFLSMGRPVFINSNQGDFKELFDKYEIGVVTDANDDKSVKKYVDEMLGLLKNAETSEKCQRLAADNFSLEEGVAKLLEIYKELD
jgi:glycosyltransferase involved in cell wall biosynthesis